MTDELPEVFEHLKSPPAPPELRPRVLAAVGRELARRKKPRWERALELSVAACLLLGVGLNVWQWQASPHRQQPAYDVAAFQAEDRAMGSADAQLERLIHTRLAVFAPRPSQQAAVSQQYERLLKELTQSGPG